MSAFHYEQLTGKHDQALIEQEEELRFLFGREFLAAVSQGSVHTLVQVVEFYDAFKRDHQDKPASAYLNPQQLYFNLDRNTWHVERMVDGNESSIPTAITLLGGALAMNYEGDRYQ